MTTWSRKCQECGHRQRAIEPLGGVTSSYRNAKCRKCKSEALDYGTSVFEQVNGEWVDTRRDEE